MDYKCIQCCVDTNMILSNVDIERIRPEGCKLYPIIYDKDKNCAVFDEDCPHRHRFKMSNSTKQQLYNLISKLEAKKA